MVMPFGETVTLHTRSVLDQDADGNDVLYDVDTVLSGVPVWPAGGTELVQGQDTLISGLFALLPAGTDVSGIDSVTVYGDEYEVDGEPGRFTNPFTGTDPGVQVHLTRVGL
ncbi:hypothetical protein [Nocardioides terrisoli]|uniref:hypothetical protein n=1 Tax=Nocardioides terrisoli TaxID=3388267 RepID=UPI00287B92FC|nr:hypothetical protein [Nocardioides marmorisolisilvae]